MKKHMDQEVEEISRVLLQKAGDSSEFIQKAADQCLDVMAQNVTPSRAMAALMANGVKYVKGLFTALLYFLSYIRTNFLPSNFPRFFFWALAPLLLTHDLFF